MGIKIFCDPQWELGGEPAKFSGDFDRRIVSDEEKGNNRRKDDINDVAGELYRAEF